MQLLRPSLGPAYQVPPDAKGMVGKNGLMRERLGQRLLLTFDPVFRRRFASFSTEALRRATKITTAGDDQFSKP